MRASKSGRQSQRFQTPQSAHRTNSSSFPIVSYQHFRLPAVPRKSLIIRWLLLYEPKGREFESLRAHHKLSYKINPLHRKLPSFSEPRSRQIRLPAIHSPQAARDHHCLPIEIHDPYNAAPLGLCQPPSAAIRASACFGPQVPRLYVRARGWCLST